MDPHTQEITTVVTKRADTPKRVYATTKGLAPNYVIRAIVPIQIVLTRAIRVYGFAVQGGLLARGIGRPIDGQIVPADDAWGALGAVMLAALFPAVASAVWNASELLLKVDLRFPSLRA